MASNQVRVLLGEQEFRKLIGGEEVVIGNVRTQLTSRARGTLTGDVDVHLLLADIGFGRMISIIEQTANSRGEVTF